MEGSMKTSDSIAKLAPALLAAQKAITFAAKDTANPFFKTKYADLPCVIDAIKGPLNDAGIVFTQSASPSEPGFLAMTTRLIHESGEWIEDTATLPLPKADPQGYGSASTYARRYALAAITGLYQDDDDGTAATGKSAATTKPTPPQSKPLDLDKACGAIVGAKTKAEAEKFSDSALRRATTEEEKQRINNALGQWKEAA